MRLLVFGGRSYNDRQGVYDALSSFHAKTPVTLIIHGACRSRVDLDTKEFIWSADELAEQWAKDNEIPYFGVPAKWHSKEGIDLSAGPKRNAWMLAKGKPNYGIGFPGGKGSQDMERRLREAGIPAHILKK